MATLTVWKFDTGSVRHTLLTGFEYQHQVLDTQRTTADLPNITNIFAPTPPALSPASLNFQCDAKHSCDNDHLVADYYGLYATDQMDLTDKWKLRVGVRQDFYDEVLDPLTTVPGRFTNTGVPLIAGVPESRNDSPVSWNVGTLYQIYPGISPYIGVSKSYLSNFNSENTFNGIGAPESALQYEAGVKLSMLHDRVVLNSSLFNISRDNVATLFSNSLGQESVAFDSQLTNGIEASLDAATRTAATEQQRAFLDAGIAACANPATTARLEAFVVVVELDAEGRVSRTWRRGDSPLALCIERQSRGKPMFVPPRAPFHASLEVGFEP